MPFEFKKLEIPEVYLIIPKVFKDERGFFMEVYKKSDFLKAKINFDFLQDNISFSTKGVLRGLHYQLHPKAQGKLVRCLKGRIWDVAVDIRKGSPTFGKWVAVELTEENKYMLWVPPGFAHGFVALEDAEVHYKTTEEYEPELDRGIFWKDPDLNISWPVSSPILSEKDKSLPLLKEAENNFIYEVNS
ncbi:MAG: dTDP-4-dehydrorhamnose 3,5-epimerase [Elusimicrobiota bacterium]|nr:dTDP-4-dehydrorhamnose 3,5-epimerase [Endomicrobiia bacterium]MDW7998799.1 dTDP-4-dehydrorhamnose 3,5-epimerase [Thermodesulfovibrio sp.]MDW8165896.1 dTDP-4-dehydrorhamnose 3,5-epimerase [Elusimicrobiota bacterium]